MNIFVDESGLFLPALDKDRSISCVGALVIPKSTETRLYRRYAELRKSLPIHNGEVKGRLLTDNDLEKIVRMLLKSDVIYEAEIIDLNTMTEDDIERHRKIQSDLFIKNLTEEHHPNVWKGVENLRAILMRTSRQLYVQSVVSTSVIYRTIINTTL